MMTETRPRPQSAPQAADRSDWRMTLVPRTGGPPLRFLGRPALHLDWGRIGPGEVACRAWAVRSGGFVLAWPVWDGAGTAMMARRVPDAPALVAALESAARAADAPEPPTMTPGSDGQLAALRLAAVRAAWADRFGDLVGTALDGITAQADCTGEAT